MRRIVVVACAGMLLGGCALTPLTSNRSLTVRAPIGNIGDLAGNSIGKQSNVYPADTVTLDLKKLIAAQIPRDAHFTMTPNTTIEEVIAAFDLAATDPGKAKAARNSIANSVVWASNANCLVYLQYLRGNQVLDRALSGSLATIFSAAATAYTPRSTKSALSALATISTGVGTTIDTSAFAQQTLDVLAGAIEADRDTYRAGDFATDMAKDYASFGLSAALTDAEIYHNKCEVMEGLHYLQLQTSSSSSPAKPSAATKPGDGPAAAAAAVAAVAPVAPAPAAAKP